MIFNTTQAVMNYVTRRRDPFSVWLSGKVTDEELLDVALESYGGSFVIYSMKTMDDKFWALTAAAVHYEQLRRKTLNLNPKYF